MDKTILEYTVADEESYYDYNNQVFKDGLKMKILSYFFDFNGFHIIGKILV